MNVCFGVKGRVIRSFEVVGVVMVLLVGLWIVVVRLCVFCGVLNEIGFFFR